MLLVVAAAGCPAAAVVCLCAWNTAKKAGRTVHVTAVCCCTKMEPPDHTDEMGHNPALTAGSMLPEEERDTQREKGPHRRKKACHRFSRWKRTRERWRDAVSIKDKHTLTRE